MAFICVVSVFFFFFKQKTAYEMRISDWSSDVCSSDLRPFSVIVAGRKVTALGTIFEVRFDKNRLKVTLLRGKVRIDEDRGGQAGAAPPATAVLAAGQIGTGSGRGRVGQYRVMLGGAGTIKTKTKSTKYIY